jgi:glycyl-tRNA synthetase beta chain
MTDFLLELRSEEIPARMQGKAREDLARLFTEALAKAGLAADSVETFATPRRLALIARGLPLATEAVAEETKGPKVGAPPQAMEGFLRKTGLTQDQLVERDGVYFAVVEKPGRKTADVLSEVVPEVILRFPWQKSMRWGDKSRSTESLRWVRPLQGIVAILGDDVVPVELVYGNLLKDSAGDWAISATETGLVSGRTTMGHRFHSSGPITIGNAGDYIEKLRVAHVIVHFSERCAIIRDGAKAAAEAAGLKLVEDEGLVAENAGLTEWPVPMLGRFDLAFLEVPEEVIQLTARVNQKYFVCHDAGGKLANFFVCTANIVANDGGAAIVAGNEKVLAARLSDAKFFWEQDLKVKLDVQREKLSQITFHEKLGTVADKVERVAKLARWLVEEGIIPPRNGEGDRREAVVEGSAATHPTGSSSDGDERPPRAGEVLALAAAAARAARLCKADLVTGMVGEFPELQGIMGGYYAREAGESDAVADAIRDHYKPVGQGDEVPTAPVTVAVSLADKLDTLVGFFATNQRPTGSKDPFALRRSALSVLGLVIQNNSRLRLRHTFKHVFKILKNQLVPNELSTSGLMKVNLGQMVAFSSVDADALATDLLDFFADRLKVQQREAGVRHDLIDAVFAAQNQNGTGEDDLVRLLARVKALQAFVATDEGVNLLAGYKRAANILKQAEGSNPTLVTPAQAGGQPLTDPFEPTGQMMDSRLRGNDEVGVGDGVRDVEAGLRSALDTAEPTAAAAVDAEDFEGAMAALASLRAPIDAFFNGVMVNDPDPDKRAFRLGLLARFRDAVHRVADFSRIEG